MGVAGDGSMSRAGRELIGADTCRIRLTYDKYKIW